MIYDVKRSLIRAKLSDIAYSDTGDIAAPLQDLGYTLDRWNGRIERLNSFVCHNSTEAIVVFQGTKFSDRDTLMADLNFSPCEARGYMVDAGVYDEYIIHEQLFKPVLDDLHTQGLRICATGHSLGGGLAGMTALFNDYVEEVYTFGGMRFCWMGGAEHLRDRGFRVVHDRDIVPLLPLLGISYKPPFLCPYVPAGKLVQINDAGDVATGWAAYERRCLALAMPFIQHSFFLGANYLRDHLLDNYIAALTAGANKTINPVG